MQTIFFVDDAQPVERQHVVHYFDILRIFYDQSCARPPVAMIFGVFSGPWVILHLFEHPLEDSVDKPDIAVEQTTLQIGDGVGADDFGMAS